MTPDERIKDLQQSLLVYRLLLLGMVLASMGAAWWLASQMYQVSDHGAAGEIWTIDLDQQVAEARQHEVGLIDLVQPYFETVGASVHMHFMGPGQTTPMHVHPEGDEVTLIVDGQARVSLAWGEHGQPAGDEQVFPAGDIIHAPPGTGHEYGNTSPEHLLAALVFSKPSFVGNLYLKPNDPRLLEGAAPFTYRPANDLEGFRASGDRVLVRRLPATGGRLIEVITHDAFTVPANLSHPIVAWVFGGKGEVDGHVLEPNVLAHLESRKEIVLEATEGEVLGMLLFDPYDGLARLEAADR